MPEEVNIFMQLLGNYAFPIVSCVAMAWYVKYTTDTNNTEMKQIREEHKAEMSQVTEALNNNTLALNKLCVMFEMGGHKNEH